MRIVQKDHIMVAGYAGRDAEVKTTKTGKRLVSFSVAASKKEDASTAWANCTAWESNGALFNAAQTIKKGFYVLVGGTFKLSDNGNPDVTCEFISVCGEVEQPVSKKDEHMQQGFVQVDEDDLPF